VLVLSFLANHVAFAVWDLTTPGDPNRRWNASLSSGVTYDDNFNLAPRPEAGLRYNSDLLLRASIPFQRLFITGQYDYGIFYPEDLHLGNIQQTHNVNISANYIATPRLGLGLTENYVSTFFPGVVTGPNGAPITLSNGGDYVYDVVGGSVNYQLSTRWIASVNGNWDIWRYASTSQATNGDHEDLSATLSFLYAVDSRTTVGVNYQYAEDAFVHPGPNHALDGYQQTAYLSLVRRFNPRLSLTLNGGYTIRNSQDGTESTSPSALGSIVYNYGPVSTLTLTVSESLSEANFGSTGAFSAQQNTSVALQANHRVTAKLSAVADLAYTYSTFTAPVTGFGPSNPSEQATSAHIGLRYYFQNWLSATTDYSHTEITSTVVQPYSRNTISVGMTVSY
jgi:hypothetical protein